MPSWVYMIINNLNECIYVGSSTNDYLCRRICDHKKPSTTLRRSKQPLYKHITEIGGWDKVSFKIIKEFEKIDKIDLLNYEKKEILERNPLCNVTSPIRTKQEDLDKRRVFQKKWRDANPDKVKILNEKRKITSVYIQQVKERCSTLVECECGGRYTAQNKTNHLKTNKHKKHINASSPSHVPPQVLVTEPQLS